MQSQLSGVRARGLNLAVCRLPKHFEAANTLDVIVASARLWSFLPLRVLELSLEPIIMTDHEPSVLPFYN